MRLAPRTAVSLYVALAVHALLLLGLALRPPSQNSAGPGLGLSLPGAGLDDIERRLATAPPPPSSNGEAPTFAQTATAAGIDDVSMQEAVAVEATPRRKAPVPAPPRAAARPISDSAAARSDAPTSRAALIGGGGSGNSYYARLRAHLAGFRHELPGGLPAATAQVRFRISPDGWISELELVKSSGVTALDAEALELFRRAAPLPAPPNARELRLVVPVSINGPN